RPSSDLLQTRPLLQYRNPAPAAGDNDMPRIKKSPDGIQFDDFLWLWRRHDPAVTLFFFHHIVSFSLLSLRLFLRQITSDHLHRSVKSFVIGIHGHLRQHRTYRPVNSPVQQFRADRVLQVVTDISLTHGRAD